MEPHRKRVQTYNVPDSGLIAMRDPWGASYFGYDALARMTARLTPNLDAVYYAYDPASNPVAQQYPRDGAAAYFGYDPAQRLVQLASPAGNGCYYEYDAGSNVTRKTLGNGVVSWASFDDADRMVSLRYARSDESALAYFEYARDVAGRILRIGRETDLAIYYSYDPIDRLEAEVWRKQSDNSQIYGFWYEYDAANNRLAMRRETDEGVEWDSSYFAYNAANEMLRRQVLTPPSTVVDTYFYYDENGSLTERVEDGAVTYYRYGGPKLVSAILPPGEDATYFYYDAGLSRYAIDRAGTLTYWLWDGLNPVEQRDAAGELLARFTNGYSTIGGIGTVVEVERHAGGATYFQYLLSDHRGTAHAVADQDEEVQLAYTLDAFGRELAPIGGADPAVPNDLIYQTNWLTLKIGGKWYGVSKNRVFDPELGIFLSRDPIPALNKYRAYSNDPVQRRDADGLTDRAAELLEYAGVFGNAAAYQQVAKIQSLARKMKACRDWMEEERRRKQRQELEDLHQHLLAIGDIEGANELLDRMAILDHGIGSLERRRRIMESGKGERTGHGWLQTGLDAVRGIGDSITGGLTKEIREGIWGEDGKVQSEYGYLAGNIAGTIMQSMITGGAGLAGKAWNAIDLAGSIYGSVQAASEGDWLGAGLGILGSAGALHGLRGGFPDVPAPSRPPRNPKAPSPELPHQPRAVREPDYPTGGSCSIPRRRAGCFVAGTGIQTPEGLVPIESLRIGDRVLTFAPEDANRFESGASCEVDAATWKAVTLTMDRGAQGTITVELLRPPEWIERHEVELWAEIYLDLEELGAQGWAKVEGVNPCPPIAEGEGRVVTATYRNTHGKPANLKLEGVEHPIGVTLRHMIWSESDGMWLPVGRLEPGDKVRVLGEIVTVASVEETQETQSVYNLEVDGDHVYRVSDAGVLVHNASGPWDPGRFKEEHNVVLNQIIPGATEVPYKVKWGGRKLDALYNPNTGFELKLNPFSSATQTSIDRFHIQIEKDILISRGMIIRPSSGIVRPPPSKIVYASEFAVPNYLREEITKGARQSSGGLILLDPVTLPRAGQGREAFIEEVKRALPGIC